MFDMKCLVLVVMAMAAVVLPGGSARSLDLAVLMNKTVCAIKLLDNIDNHRVPRRIRMITCAADTHQGCAANSIPDEKCCYKHNKMECVEMRDSVMVFDKRLNAKKTIEVAVGCACMISESTAPLVPPHNDKR